MTISKCNNRYNVWVGAVSSGKTFASTKALANKIINMPPGDCMILGYSRQSIQRNVLKELYKTHFGWEPPHENKTHDRIYGRDLYFVGCSDVGSMRSIQGASLILAYGDEVVTWPQACFKMLQSRLRIPGAEGLFTCNPEGPNHWFKKEFLDRSKQFGGDLDITSWTFFMDDNPFLDESYKENQKKEYTGMWYKRYILGEWAVAHGLIYDSFDHDNVYENPSLNYTSYIVGVDYGVSNATAAVLIAVNPKQMPQLSVVAEYYYDSAKKGRQKTDDELAQDVYDFVKYKNISAVYVDPSAASFKIELGRRNLPVVDANNEVLEGIKTVSKFISGKNLVIHRSCQTLLDCIQSYSWCPKAADRGEDKPLKERDHIMDALRYACFTAFPEGDFNSMDQSLYKQHQQAYYGDTYQNPLGMPSGGYF